MKGASLDGPWTALDKNRGYGGNNEKKEKQEICSNLQPDNLGYGLPTLALKPGKGPVQKCNCAYGLGRVFGSAAVKPQVGKDGCRKESHGRLRTFDGGGPKTAAPGGKTMTTMLWKHRP